MGRVKASLCSFWKRGSFLLLDNASAKAALIFLLLPGKLKASLFPFSLFLMAFLSLSDYWQLQGFSKEEADCIATRQAQYDEEAAEAAELNAAGFWNAS